MKKNSEPGLFGTLGKHAPNRVFISVILGALAGIAYSWLIPIVLATITADDVPTDEVLPPTVLGFEVSHYGMATLFLFTCVFILLARSLSQIMLSHVSLEVATSLRMRIYERISRAPISDLERLGVSRLTVALTSDVGRFVSGAGAMPDMLVNMVTLIGMLGFLRYMNKSVFIFVIGAIAFGVLTYQLAMLIGRRPLARARGTADELQESVRGLIEGAKELKLSRQRRESFFEEMLRQKETEILTLEKRGTSIVRLAADFGDLISFFVIGAITFIFVNYRSISNAELLGVVMALLYITGPVAIILHFFPQVTIAMVSLRRIRVLFDSLSEEALTREVTKVANWTALHFVGVSYEHRESDGASFRVGPIDLQITRGQITFIVGGNGSGKSTLSKLITLHYLPESGAIRFGDTLVNEITRESCRQQISAVYSDYYLFDRLHGIVGDDIQARAGAYLRLLRLDHKVSIRAGCFSTLDLSTGQRKRLALLVAFLEDKELYLFDEWAADQDPEFKAVFYNQILPDLKARNKAVVVISHDDKYFHIADQILTMTEGRCMTHRDQHAGTVPANGKEPPAMKLGEHV